MKPENVKCPDCGGAMTPRTSRYGKFWGCKNYPRCTGTLNADGEPRKRGDGDPSHEVASASPSERWRDRDKRRWDGA